MTHAPGLLVTRTFNEGEFGGMGESCRGNDVRRFAVLGRQDEPYRSFRLRLF